MKKFFFAAALVSLAAACDGSSRKNGANVKYGFLSDFVPTILMLSPTDSLLVCGSDQFNLRKDALVSVRKWAEAAGRSDLRVEERVSCSERRSFTASIQAAYSGNGCYGSVLGYHSQSGHHHDIVTCPLAARGGTSTQTMLHEVGHAYGMCDQYADNAPGRIVLHKNCVSDFKSVSAARSVMGGGYPGSPSGFTADDILGIRVGACRGDLPSNAQWIAKNSEELTSWKSEALLTELRRLQDRGLPILPECLSDAPPVDPTPTPGTGRCDEFKQQVNVKQQFFGWSYFTLSLTAPGNTMSDVVSVSYALHSSFGSSVFVKKPSNGFETRGFFTHASGWKTEPATVTLVSGERCVVPGVAFPSP